MPTREENDERRRKSLCMWCGQRYTAIHNEEDPEVFFDYVDTLEEPTIK